MAVAEEDLSAVDSKPISVLPKSDNANYIRIENITKSFDKFVAVDNVSLAINKGEIFALLGSSGCGKSTLLRMLAGFEIPSEGRIYIDGQDMSSIPPYLRPVNMMFQSYALFPHLTVAQNIEFGLKQDAIPKTERLEQVAKMLELVRMSAYAKRKPHQLSGGQKQRVALARSLAKKPKLLLLDEPMGALDKKLRGQMQLEVVEILERVGVTCVMVTHDQEEAMTMAGRIGIMDKGRLLQVGAPTVVYETPNSRFTAEFIGSANMFEGILVEDEPNYVKISCPAIPNKFYVEHGITGEEGMQVCVAIRPEKITILTEQPDHEYNWAKGVVHDIAYLGSHSIYYINLESGKRVQATVANQGRFSKLSVTWKDDVYISWHSESMVVLTS